MSYQFPLDAHHQRGWTPEAHTVLSEAHANLATSLPAASPYYVTSSVDRLNCFVDPAV